MTVNAELQQKIDQLTQANNDLNNLPAGTGVATIFIDHLPGWMPVSHNALTTGLRLSRIRGHEQSS